MQKPMHVEGRNSAKPESVTGLYLRILCEILSGVWLRPIEIEDAVWERVRFRGTKREGVGGIVRRLLQEHCIKHRWNKRHSDLFVYKDGLYSLKLRNGRKTKRFL